MINLENLQEYKLRNNFINNFFLSNNILFMKSDNKSKKIYYDKLEKDNKKNTIYIMNKYVNNNYKNNYLKNIVSNIIDQYDKPEGLYINKRINIQSDIILSQKMNIKIKQIDKKTKNILIVYNFYKIKELVTRKGLEYFAKIYKQADGTEPVEKLIDRMEKGLIVFDFNEYAYILTLKKLINIYYKEVDSTINLKSPSFQDQMLLKYLDNFFSKYAIIKYDEVKVKNFISKYYITEFQSEDQCNSFVRNFMKFFEIIFKMDFILENKHRFNLKELYIRYKHKAINLKCNNFHIHFDNVMKEENNYYNFMFLLENLELIKTNSDRKNITDYITIVELFIVKGDMNISKQIQDKCMELANSNDITKEELKIIYNYRSKLIHGDYRESINKINELSKIPPYNLIKIDDLKKSYLTIEQLIEKKIKERLFKILSIILKKFIIDNDKLTKLKYKNIESVNK